MEPVLKISQRDIILVYYPFSGGEKEKLRPCIVISSNSYNFKGEDIIVVPLTTNIQTRDYCFILAQKDLESGELIKESKVKTDRVFSIKKALAKTGIGKVKKEIHEKITKELSELTALS